MSATRWIGLEPDCILLDGAGRGDFGASWLAAAAISERARPIPVIMFSVDGSATAEAQEGTSARSVRADFAAVLPKPFELEALLTTVAAALEGGDALSHRRPHSCWSRTMAGDTARARLRGELARFSAALRAHRLSGFASPLEHARLRSEFVRLRGECQRLGLVWRGVTDADDPGPTPS